MKVVTLRAIVTFMSLFIVCSAFADLPDHLEPLYQEYDFKYRSAIEQFRNSSESIPVKLKNFDMAVDNLRSRVRSKMIQRYNEFGTEKASVAEGCRDSCTVYPRVIVLHKADTDVDMLFSYISSQY